jgi:hypothetical protein
MQFNGQGQVVVTDTPKGFWGPFSLTPRGIDAAVSDPSIGVYALGRVKQGTGDFEVCYVGRDDQDIRSGLKQHVAEWYPQFLYKYFFSPKAAFEKECELYHDFHPTDNKAHPAKAEGTDWTCPRCRFFDK